MEWVRHSSATATPNLICVYMGPKFETPSNARTSSVPQKRGRTGNPTARVMVAAPLKSEMPTKTNADSSSPVIPPRDGR